MKSLKGWGIVVCLLCATMGNARAAEWFVATNGNDEADGTSWATAKLTIQAGVDVAADGDTVWVSNGVYATGGRVAVGAVGTNRVAVSNALTLRSINGPELTIIDGSNQVRGVYLTPNAVLNGFTVTKGLADIGGGVYCNVDALVTNCTILQNKAGLRGGGVAFGRIWNCKIWQNISDFNESGNFGGGVYSSAVYNSSIYGNSAWGVYGQGGGIFGGMASNCLIERNESYLGGGTSDAFVENSMIISNQARYGSGSHHGTNQNCLIVRNIPHPWNGGHGGGAYQALLINCTLCYNLMNGDGAGSWECNVRNSIFYFNDCGSGTATYSRADTLLTGEGNITNDPQFVDAAAGNYHLRRGSPCINAGNNADVEGEADLEGNSRIITDIVDMGAYELNPDLVIDPASTNLPYEETSGNIIEVWASVPWTASTNVPWISITSGDSGTTNETVVFGVEANPAVGGARTGAVVVAGGGLTRTCMVVQAGIPPEVEIDPAQTNLSFEGEGENSIQLLANISWTATTNVPWLAITDGASGTTNGKVDFSVAANGLTSSRTGAVIIAGGDLSRTCTVVQAGIPPVLEMDPDVTNLPSVAASGVTFAVTANLPWTSTTDVPWLSITSGASGTTNGEVVYSVGWNPWPVARTGAVVVSGGGLSRTSTVIQAARDGMATNWYVATTGNDAADGLSWATAKLTIQAAINAAVDGDTVWVDAGTYLGSLNIPNGIRLASVDGPRVTTIRANGGRCITIPHFNAVVSGFTITGGRDEEGAGVYMSATNALIEHCIVTSNGATAYNGTPWDSSSLSLQGGGILGGRARNCIIAGNFLQVTHLGRYASAVAYGAGAAESWLENCTVVSNIAGANGYYSSGAGGTWGGQTMNCIVWSNYDKNHWNLDGENPLFADSTFHLSSNSPCIDAGTNQDWMVEATDLDGNQRIKNGTVDIGAYELTDFSIAPTRTNLSHWATSGNIEVMASVPWRATTNVPWLSVTSGDSGTTNGTVVFHAEGNGSMAPRRGAIIVFKGDFARTCTVVQAGAMTIAPTNVHLSCEATSGISIAVSTWAPWTAESTVPWLTISSGASGISSGTVVINAEANSLATTRTGTVMVTASADSGNSLSMTIVQGGNPGWDVGFQDLGDGWRRLSWFGDYNVEKEDGWIWHNVHGFFQVSATATPGSIWFYAEDMGWLWTSCTQYPTFYRSSDGAWLWYNGSSNPRWFMNLSSGRWERWPNVGVQADWYVTTNGNDAAVGTSWATAKCTIQAAVDVATAGGRVWVSNGVYATGGATNYPAGSTLTNRVAIYKLLTVQSVNGPEVTIIQGSGTNGDGVARCVYVGSNAVLSGFTLTNGVTLQQGGGAYCEKSGVINHCNLLGNLAGKDGGGVLGGILNFCILSGNRVDEYSGGGAFESTLNDCLVINNSGASYGGGAYGSTLNRCRLSQNRATQGGGAYNCTLNSCLVDNNLHGLQGGGAFESTLYNCTAVSNNVEVCNIYNSILFNVVWWGGDCISTYTGDPLFVDEAAGNYRLSNRSPCIDAGNNAYVQGVTDLDGSLRVVAGIVDQGAYEFQGVATYRGWASAITNGQTNDTDCAAGDGVPNVLKYAAGSTNPMVSDDLAQLDLNCGLVPMLVFCRNPNAADLQWIVEGADVVSNGVVWRGLATNINGSWGGATNVHESGTGTPVVCTVEDSVPLLTNRFLRLKVTRP